MMSHVPDWKDECIDMEDDVHLKAEELPGGFTTLWLDVSQRPNRDDDIKVILSKLSQLAEIRNKSVTVLYFPIENSSEEKAAEQECKRLNWNFRENDQMYGCEDEVIIAIDALYPETISRPHNLLVVVTTAGTWLVLVKIILCW